MEGSSKSLPQPLSIDPCYPWGPHRQARDLLDGLAHVQPHLHTVAGMCGQGHR